MSTTEPPGGVHGSGRALADQALENLVNQFARPMDFLRELVQNSIDAGSARVDIKVDFVPPSDGAQEGVAEIWVVDHGEGMDEHTIDNQLTRMFASAKEDDLTKIGKFGIGFTSIFALRPEAVLMRTGRHGESWELLFHADRSFEKVRLDTPISGTTVTLYKRMPAAEVDSLVRECRWVLRYWCEHSDTPIRFVDARAPKAQPAAPAADPFAAFAAPQARGSDTINSPLGLEADLCVEHREDDVHLWVGYGATPLYGFYNGGLTLLSTTNADVLGDWAPRLGHLRFKLKCDALEHTLTRDNVLQDAAWARAMEVLGRAAQALLSRLVAHTAQQAEAGAALERWQRHLAAEWAAGALPAGAPAARSQPAFRDATGQHRSLDEVEDQEAKVGCVLLATGDRALTQALGDMGLFLLTDDEGTRHLLRSAVTQGGLRLLQKQRVLRPAAEVFVLPQLVPTMDLPAAEQVLIGAATRLLAAAAGKRVRLKVGDFGGAEQARTEGLCLDGPAEGGVFQRGNETWFRVPDFLRRRTLLLNRHHACYRAQVVAAGEQPTLAAVGLLQAVLTVEGVEPEATHSALLDAACAQLGAGA